MKKTLLLLITFPILISASEIDPLEEYSKRVKKFTLKNGMRVLVVERPHIPTVSFAMYIKTGALEDESGKTGMAHMFEHMLFKGTKTIGVTDYKKERPLLQKIDQATLALQQEKDKGDKSDPDQLKKWEENLKALQKQHEPLVVEEEFWRIYEEAGGRGLNAGTGYDTTNYQVSLPVNQLKLWMVMESERIKNPVLREFYKERAVVMEERRSRTDNSPGGRLWESFLATAFMAHPYGNPIVGWESDISRVTRADAKQFFKKHYDISRMVVAIVGGINAAEVEKLMHEYFDSIPSEIKLTHHRIPVEPDQKGERRVLVNYDAEPMVLIGYHRPNMYHADSAALDVAADILGDGRTSRFNKAIVQKKRIAVSAWASYSTPGDRDPNLFAMGGSPRSPHTTKDLEKAMEKQIEIFKKEGPTERELQRVKNQMEVFLFRGLSSNAGLANQLGYFEAVTGDWKTLLRFINEIQQVTVEDVKRVTTKYLVPSNRTVATLVRTKK